MGSNRDPCLFFLGTDRYASVKKESASMFCPGNCRQSILSHLFDPDVLFPIHLFLLESSLSLFADDSGESYDMCFSRDMFLSV